MFGDDGAGDALAGHVRQPRIEQLRRPVSPLHTRCVASVLFYVANQGLGFTVPYRMGGEARTYIPDFIVRVDDGHGDEDPLNLVVEVKGYRQEDAKVKKQTMENYWVPAVNRLRDYGRWAFVELKDVYMMRGDLDGAVGTDFGKQLAPLLSLGG